MEIKVLGTGCGKCKTLYNAAKKAVEESGVNVDLSKEEDIAEIIKYNAMRLPAIVIDGKIVSQGEILSVEKIKNLINKGM